MICLPLDEVEEDILDINSLDTREKLLVNKCTGRGFTEECRESRDRNMNKQSGGTVTSNKQDKNR
jgi:hypothetical protein